MVRFYFRNSISPVVNRPIFKGLATTQSLLGLLATTGLAITGSSMALANDDDKSKQIGMEEVSVYGQQITTQSSTGSRLDLSVLEIPATVEVISGNSIRERLDFTVIDAVTRSAGFTSEATPGNGGQSIAARGFRGQGAVTKLYDGTSYFNAYGTVTFPFDTWSVERIEILKGPSSVLYGEGGIGGAVNVVPKAPSQEQSGVLRATFGEDNTSFVGLSLNGGLTETLAARIDYSTSQSDGWVDSGDSETDVLSVAFLWDVSEDLKLTLRYDSGDQKPMVYSGTAIENGDFIPGLEYSNFQVSDARIRYEDESIRLRADWGISDAVAMQAELYHLESDRFWQVIENFRPGTGANAGLIERSGPALIAHDMEQDGLRVNVSFAQEIAGIDARSSVGFEMNDVSFVRPFNFGSGSQIISPDSFSPGLYADITTGTELVNRVSADLTQYALFAESQLQLTEQLALVLGLRYEDTETDFETTGAGDFDQSADVVTGRAGLVFDVNNSTALYAQYSTGATHPSNNLLTANSRNRDTDFIDTEQVELGVKQQLLDGRVQWALAYFDITRNNLTDDNPTSSDPNDLIEIAEQTSEGVELSFSVQVLDSLQIYGNGSVLDAKMDGNQTTRLVPEKTANFGLVWAALDNVQIVADGRYVGKREDRFAPIPSYMVVDTSAKVMVNDNLSLTVKFENVFDERYTASTISYYDGVWLVGKPRTFSLTADYRF